MTRNFALNVVAALCAGCVNSSPTTETSTLNYPPTATIEQIDNYHGTEVRDPYRWLEEDVRESDRVRDWVEAQNELTFGYLSTLPDRERIEARLTELWNYEKFSIPNRAAGRYFYSRNDGLQNQSVIYMQSSLDSEPEILIDPNQWSADGTIALAGANPSRDGRWMAYGVQDGGSDWRTWRVLDLETRKVLNDRIEWVKFSSVVWDGDGEGLFYARYPETDSGDKFQSLNLNHTLYYHRLGTPQSEDRVVYARPDHPDWGFAPVVTEDGRWLVITIWKGTDERYQIVYLSLEDETSEPAMLVEGFDNEYVFIGNDDQLFYFQTNLDAPRGRLVAIDLSQPEPEHWREIIPQRDDVLAGVSYVGGRFVAQYMHDAQSHVQVFARDGKAMQMVTLPGIGTAAGFGGDHDNPETFYLYSSFNAPPTIYRYDVVNGQSEIFKKADVDFDPAEYVVRQVFYRSKDGTRIPMFVSHRRDIEINGENPTLLYGYGGFNVSELPQFSITRLAWMEMGGVYAVANLRGGGEYGKAWHKAGTKLQKQNVFDDFIAAAEHLIDSNYTHPAKLAIFGGSNGGLLVGAVLNQRPDLFGAATPAVGVMDMLRFHRFTAGRFWVDDYGSAENPEEFRALYAYSPYHNIRTDVDYPAVLVTTADTDDRVVPGHSFKYIAALQAAQAGSEPVLIRIETRAGHGAGKPTAKTIEEYADRWAFLAHHLGLKLPAGYGNGARVRR